MSGASIIRNSLYWCGIREYFAHLGSDADRLMIIQTEVWKEILDRNGRERGQLVRFVIAVLTFPHSSKRRTRLILVAN